MFGGRHQFFRKLPSLSAREMGVFGRGSRGRRFCKNASPGELLRTERTTIMKIRITVGDLSVNAQLNDTPTAKKVAAVLPLKAGFSTWGDEIYFTIPVDAQLDESAKEVVDMGELGYWPTGKAFCIFFGPTPMSEPGKIVPASAVNIIGKVIGDAADFKSVMNEDEVRLELDSIAGG